MPKDGRGRLWEDTAQTLIDTATACFAECEGNLEKDEVFAFLVRVG